MVDLVNVAADAIRRELARCSSDATNVGATVRGRCNGKASQGTVRRRALARDCPILHDCGSTHYLLVARAAKYRSRNAQASAAFGDQVGKLVVLLRPPGLLCASAPV